MHPLHSGQSDEEEKDRCHLFRFLESLRLHQSEFITIEQVSSMNDLGVLFDNYLTFRNHVQKASKLWNALGAAKKFCHEIKNRRLIMKIFFTYLRPHIDHASVIWNTNTIGANALFERILRKTTAYAVNNRRYDHPDYINYEERLRQLDLLSISKRLQQMNVVLVLKMIRNELLTNLNEELRNNTQEARPGLRNPLLFGNFQSRFNSKHFMHILMNDDNNLRGTLNSNITTNTNKKNILLYLLTN